MTTPKDLKKAPRSEQYAMYNPRWPQKTTPTGQKTTPIVDAGRTCIHHCLEARAELNFLFFSRSLSPLILNISIFLSSKRFDSSLRECFTTNPLPFGGAICTWCWHAPSPRFPSYGIHITNTSNVHLYPVFVPQPREPQFFLRRFTRWMGSA